MSEEREIDRAEAEEPPTAAPGDPTLAILKACGPMAALVYHVVRANDREGLPNTYVAIGEQVERNPTHVMRVCKKLEAAGFVEVIRSEGKSVASVVKPRELGVTSGVTKTSHHDENVTPTGVTSGVTSPPTPPVVVEDVKTDDPPTPQPATNGHRPAVPAGFRPTYRNILGATWPVMVKQYQGLDRDLNEPWLAGLLCQLEPDIGPLSEEQLRTALGLSWEATKRKLIGERRGQEHIRSVRGLAKVIIAERLTEARHG